MPRRSRWTDDAGIKKDGIVEDVPRNLVKPEPFKRGELIQNYVTYFERVVKANRWSDEEAGKGFAALMPPGERYLDNLPNEALNSFERIKDEVAKGQIPFREANLEELMRCWNKTETESIMSFYNRTCKQIELVYATFENNAQKQLKRDFFVHGLPTEVRKAVQSAKTKDLEETVNAAMMADSLQAKAENSILAQVVTKKMINDETPEIKNVAETDVVATLKTKPQATSFQQNITRGFPFRRMRRNRIDFSRIRCWNCQGFGHFQSVCPTRNETPMQENNH
jgi:hypothetical protein